MNIANYAGDNIPFTTGKIPSEVISNPKLASDRTFVWFYKHFMKTNQGKYHL